MLVMAKGSTVRQKPPVNINEVKKVPPSSSVVMLKKDGGGLKLFGKRLDPTPVDGMP